MPAWQWALLLVSLILIVFFIIFGRNIVDYRYVYGTWVTRETACTSSDGGSCKVPGVQYTGTYCVPDAKTRRGCIGPNGLQTYAPTIQATSCTLQCQQYKWNVDTGSCDSNTGLQHITYTCVNKDIDGINGCTTAGLVPFADGFYQDVTTYSVGDVVEWDIKCVSPDGSGAPAPLLPSPPSSSSFPPSSSSFPTFASSPTAASLGIYYSLEEDCSSSHIFQEGVRVGDGTPCRFWDPTKIQLTLFELADTEQTLVPLYMPHTSRSPNLDFHNYGPVSRQLKLGSVPLVPLPYTKFRPDYGHKEHQLANGALLILPEAGVTKGRVGVLLGTGYWGWLGLDSDQRAIWTQAPFRPGDPGLSWEQAPQFRFNYGPGDQLEIRSGEGLRIFTGKGGTLLKGRLIQLHPNLDLSFRLQNPANVYRNYIH